MTRTSVFLESESPTLINSPDSNTLKTFTCVSSGISPISSKKIVVEMIREEMLEAAENLEFEKAAKLRDEMNKLEKEIKL